MSHVNPLHPNIYQDKLAASNSIDLRAKNKLGFPTAKRHLIPRKDYRHCADAQVLELGERSEDG